MTGMQDSKICTETDVMVIAPIVPKTVTGSSHLTAVKSSEKLTAQTVNPCGT